MAQSNEFIPLAQLKEHLSRWIESATSELDEVKLFVGVDVGGTNTRVVIGNLLTMEKISLESVKISNCRQLVKHLESVSQVVASVNESICSAGSCIAIAGRIMDFGRKVEVTNYAIINGPEDQNLTTDELPEVLFPRGNGTTLVNDLEGCCFGVSNLVAMETFHTRFQVLLQPEGGQYMEKGHIKLNSRGHYVVMAMGTGLGVGLLYSKTARNPSSKSFHVVATESGHMLATHPASANTEDANLMDYVAKSVYDGKHPMEWEDVCSGRGLLVTYKWVCHTAGVEPTLTSPEQISKAAVAAERVDPLAEKAMLFHYRFLFLAAQQLAIMTSCDGVLLAGDNIFNNLPFVERNIDIFRETFHNHPKTAWLRKVAVFVPRGLMNINILGALFVSSQIATVGHL